MATIGERSVRRDVILVACWLALVSGCSRKAPPMKAAAFAKPTAPRPAPAPDDTGTLGDANNVSASARSQVQMAERWGDKLNSSNATTATDAAAALGSLGEHGYPYLVKGMQSSSDGVRLSSLKSMHITQLVSPKHQDETLPILVAMLRDPNPALRCSAVARLPWYGKAAGKYLQMAQVLANNDPDGNVRAAAAVAVNGLYEAMSGKKITGGPDDPKIR
jgi:hypothetical protein